MLPMHYVKIEYKKFVMHKKRNYFFFFTQKRIFILFLTRDYIFVAT